MTFRILVTGSRGWLDWEMVYGELDKRAALHGYAGLVIVHGACRNGPDRYAQNWVAERRALGVTDEPHPADWPRHGNRAGMIRNAAMVRAGADLCVAFIRDGSPGASMTARLAERAGITTVRYVYAPDTVDLWSTLQETEQAAERAAEAEWGPA